MYTKAISVLVVGEGDKLGGGDKGLVWEQGRGISHVFHNSQHYF